MRRSLAGAAALHAEAHHALDEALESLRPLMCQHILRLIDPAPDELKPPPIFVPASSPQTRPAPSPGRGGPRGRSAPRLATTTPRTPSRTLFHPDILWVASAAASVLAV